MLIRPISHFDIQGVAAMCSALWPDSKRNEHVSELLLILEENGPGPYPSVVFVADVENTPLVGFTLVGMRSHADGCNPLKPVGYVEGWFVKEGYRARGIGRALLEAAENWARRQGCEEIASDTWLDNLGSQHAHDAMGYEVVDRCVNYRKSLLTNIG